ncbi:MAG: hypothetical protein IKN18_05135 [Neisseriaceae bacterium]|nr:hypothetical protein [Neisseriaceae bacterium]
MQCLKSETFAKSEKDSGCLNIVFRQPERYFQYGFNVYSNLFNQLS